MRRFKVVCDNCNGTGKDGDCDWCMSSGYHVVVRKDNNVPLGAFEEIPFGTEGNNSSQF